MVSAMESKRAMAVGWVKANGAKAGLEVAVIEGLSQDARFRRMMLTATLVWGFGLVAISAGCCALVYAVSIKLYLLINGPITYGAIGLLTLWTYWYLRGSKLRAPKAG
jgi:hypothetical protein